MSKCDNSGALGLMATRSEYVLRAVRSALSPSTSFTSATPPPGSDPKSWGRGSASYTVAAVMAEQHPVARAKHSGRSTTRPDKSARKAPNRWAGTSASQSGRSAVVW